jgi:hypothetical protein
VQIFVILEFKLLLSKIVSPTHPWKQLPSYETAFDMDHFCTTKPVTRYGRREVDGEDDNTVRVDHAL